MHGLHHNILYGPEKVIDIIEIDASHGRNLENPVGERSFATVNDEPAFAQSSPKFVEIQSIRQANGRNRIGKDVIGMKQGQANIRKSAPEGSSLFGLETEAVGDAFFENDFEGFVERDEQRDGRRIRRLLLMGNEIVVSGEIQVIIAHRIFREPAEFRDTANDQGKTWIHSDGFSRRRTHKGHAAFLEIDRIDHEAADGIDEQTHSVLLT